MTPVFFDTHAHLDFPDFKSDFSGVLERARSSGVSRIIAIGTDLDSSRRAIMMAEAHDEIFAVAGWHPNHASEAPEDIRDELAALAAHPKVVAIGETGIDRHRLPEPGPGQPDDLRESLLRRQRRLFQQQLEVACALRLNCVIHQRAALDDTLEVLQPCLDRTKGVFHCFVDGPAAAQRVLDLGCLVSFTGILTFKSAADVRASLAVAPPGKFMLETDCPFLAPMPHRGQRCEPSYVPHIAAVAAQVKGIDIDAISRSTCEAARQFFPRLG